MRARAGAELSVMEANMTETDALSVISESQLTLHQCYKHRAAFSSTHQSQSRSTQPCIPPGSLNRVPALAGVKAGKSPLPGGR